MKKTTETPGTLQVVDPQDILDRHIRKAGSPFAEDLKKACALDVQLAAAADKINPAKIKEQADKLVASAISGDEKANAELEAAGGKDAWAQSKGAMFDVREGARVKAAQETAPLWEKISAALTDAVDVADAEIQKQFDAAMTLLGEPLAPSRWNRTCQILRGNLQKASFHAEKLNQGADYQTRQMGLQALIE
jgi:hypothetical protein